jgi:hypothetical protein
MMKRNIFRKGQAIFFTLLIFFLLIFAGCGGGNGGGNGGGGNGSSGGTINLGWNPNTESDLAGYRVYYRTSLGAYDNWIDVGMGTSSGGLITYSLTNLTKGQTYCIAVTAYDTSNYESGFSNEVCGVAG